MEFISLVFIGGVYEPCIYRWSLCALYLLACQVRVTVGDYVLTKVFVAVAFVCGVVSSVNPLTAPVRKFPRLKSAHIHACKQYI